MNATLAKVTQLKTSYATIQLGAAKADGRLTLTEHLLHFEALNKQLDLGSYAIKRDTIARVERCTAKAAGIIPIGNTGIKITTKDHHSLEFIIAEPDAWLQSLQVSH